MTGAVSGSDLVHSHTWYAAMAGHWAKLLYDVPHVVTAHSLEPQRPWKAEQLGGGYRLSSWAERTAMEGADAVVAVSKGMREDVLAAYPAVDPARVHVISNGIDAGSYQKLLHEASDPEMPLRLLYIGRLARDKGIEETLHAVRLVRDRGTEVRVVIAGSGPHGERLRWLAAELGIADIVSFPGVVFGSTKRAVLGAADVLVLASHAEGLPYALLEGMAAGLPAIATRVGAIPDVVVDGTHGVFVPVRDQGAIAEAITWLAADRERLARMGAACSKRIAAEYSMDRLAEDFARLYAELLPDKRLAPLS